jgi:hypothetical protein
MQFAILYLPFCYLKIRIKICKTIALFVLYGLHTVGRRTRTEVVRTMFEVRSMKWQKAGENCITKSFFTQNIIRTFVYRNTRRAGHRPSWGDEKCVQNYGWKVWREGNTQKTRDNTKICLSYVGFVWMDWIYGSENRDRGPAFVNTVMKLLVS